VILYEMLTGEMPFHGANPFAVMNARLVTSPIAPREINPKISPGLQQIVMRALERDPDHRYASAQQFAEDLSHPDDGTAIVRPALVDLRRSSPAPRRSLVSSLMRALLPAVVFGFLLYLARAT
jgi:serine/threonine protein kinase